MATKKKNQHWEVLFSCRHFSTARKKWIYIGFCYPTLTELLCKYTHYTLFHIRSWKKEKKQRQGRNEGALCYHNGNSELEVAVHTRGRR